MTRRIIISTISMILLSFSLASFAQGGAASLTGSVTDPRGLPIIGAKVDVTNHDTAVVYSAVTNEAGHYTLPNLPPGQYELVAGQQGFQRLVRPSVQLHVAETVAIDLSLQIGSVSETVTVTGGAPLVNTTTSDLGGLVEGPQLSQLPLNGRNYINLTLMQPGIINVPNMVRTSGGTAGTWFSANGATQRSNNFTLDGAIMQTFNGGSTATFSGTTLGLDGIAEYRVITNAFPAEYGLSSGSQTVMVSKSGTNRLHGSAFEYLRNDVFDAANYFDRPAASGGRRLPPFRRNNFGGSFGGPIFKDKTFFFTTFETLHERKGITTVSTTLGAGCHAAAGATVTNTACPQLGSTSTVTVAAITAPIVALFPNPNLSNNQLTFPFSQPTTVYYGLMRVDHNISTTDKLFARYNIDNANTVGSLPFPEFLAPLVSQNQFVTIGEDHVFSAQALNSLRLSGSRTADARSAPTFPLGPQYSFIPGQVLPQITIAGLQVFGPQRGATNLDQTILTLGDDFSYAPGRHTFKFGTLINRYRWDMTTLSNVAGGISFASVASFLQGIPSSYTAVSSNNVGLLRTYNFYTLGFYGQDSWQITRHLTLNYGLRYEPRSSVLEAHGIQSVLMNPATDASYTPGPLFKNLTWHNLSPRIGFAWDPTGQQKTAVRGGAALLYDVANFATTLIAQALQRPPFVGTSLISGSNLTLSIPLSFPASALGRSGNSTWEYNLPQPKFYTWNLAVEQQLPGTTSLLISYAGSRGNKLYQTHEGNYAQAQFINGQPFWASNAPLLNPNWGSTVVIGSHGDSYYHALQTMLKKRLSHGLLLQASYTWSKMIDDEISQATGDSTTAPSFLANPYNPRYDRSVSDLDLSQVFVANALYDIPVRKFSNRLANILTGGWAVSGIFSAQTGIPFTPNIAVNQSRSKVNGGSAGNSGGIDRPNWNFNFTGPLYLKTTAHWFDPNAFSLQPAGFLGNAGRNSLYGPELSNFDFALRKGIPLGVLGEAGKLEFRAEAFNLLNHPNFSVPNNVVFSSSSTPLATAGQITSTSNSSRQVQLSLRMEF